jgi:hypothetical protein
MRKVHLDIIPDYAALVTADIRFKLLERNSSAGHQPTTERCIVNDLRDAQYPGTVHETCPFPVALVIRRQYRDEEEAGKFRHYVAARLKIKECGVEGAHAIEVKLWHAGRILYGKIRQEDVQMGKPAKLTTAKKKLSPFVFGFLNLSEEAILLFTRPLKVAQNGSPEDRHNEVREPLVVWHLAGPGEHRSENLGGEVTFACREELLAS